MSQQTFSSILSSIGRPAQAPPQSSSDSQRPLQPGQQPRKPNDVTNGVKLSPNNAVAGVKRKSEEPEAGSRPKTAKTEQDGGPARPVAPANRFQLSAKPGTAPKPPEQPQRTSLKPSGSSGSQKSVPKAITTSTVGPSPVSPPTSNGSVGAKRGGYAAILARGQAVQEAAKAVGPSVIKHKPAEKMSRRERRRRMEEAEAQKKAAKSGNVALADRSRNDVAADEKPGLQKKGQETSYKGTMKKAPEPLSYKGTMRTAGSGAADKDSKKRQAQDKYGEYASGSDLSAAEEDEDEEDFDSDASSDMEGGFDDVEQEEMRALRVAKKEDQEALAEEERLQREKLERKRKLLQLSKSAAAKKKMY